jgi:hypothetical protein
MCPRGSVSRSPRAVMHVYTLRFPEPGGGASTTRRTPQQSLLMSRALTSEPGVMGPKGALCMPNGTLRAHMCSTNRKCHNDRSYVLEQ